MAQEQNYQVNYVINVEATQGTKQVMAFADSVSKLTQAKASLAPAVQNIRGMMADSECVVENQIQVKVRDFPVFTQHDAMDCGPTCSA
jgi:hypothetical protein